MGMKGVRIQAVVRELNNEKIDILNFSNESEIFIPRALTPAKPVKVIVNQEDKLAVAIIKDDEMSLAIGRNGQNLRLASEITGYQIEPIKESEYEAEGTAVSTSIEDVDELSPSIKKKLIKANIYKVIDARNLGEEGLAEIQGLGPKSVEKILEVIQEYLSKSQDIEEDEEEDQE